MQRNRDQHPCANSLSRFAVPLLPRGFIPEDSWLSAILQNRLAPMIGIAPTLRAIEEHIERMHEAGASYSHIVNTLMDLEGR